MEKGWPSAESSRAVISQIEANKSEVSDKCYSKCNCVVITGNFMIHTFSFVI